MKRPDVPYYYKDDQWFFSEGYSGLDELQGNIEEWVEYADYLEDEIAKLQKRHPENCKCFNCYIGYGLTKDEE